MILCLNQNRKDNLGIILIFAMGRAYVVYTRVYKIVTSFMLQTAVAQHHIHIWLLWEMTTREEMPKSL